MSLEKEGFRRGPRKEVARRKETIKKGERQGRSLA